MLNNTENKEWMSKYTKHMNEVKKRTEIVTAFVRKEIHSKYLITTTESAALQIRKILELIALSSLRANPEKYKEYCKKFKERVRVKRIFQMLKEINPKFYPDPTKQNKVSEGYYDNIPIKSGYLTKEEFIMLYDKCSSFLHVDNSFSSSKNNKENMQNFLFNKIPKWMTKINVLLNHHYVHPIDDNKMYIVVMAAGEDKKVQIAEFRRINF